MDLDPQTEQALADMSTEDWAALTARVRPPTSSEQLQSIAAKHIAPDQLNTFMAIADPKKFASANGDIDEDKVMGHLTAFFGPQQASNWEQHSGSMPGVRAGETARAALEKRHGVKPKVQPPTERPGDIARAAIEQRYGAANTRHA